ncbi:MAG: 7TM diverse intracellular signaling domain-containing protein [Flavobacteriales bacterium]
MEERRRSRFIINLVSVLLSLTIFTRTEAAELSPIQKVDILLSGTSAISPSIAIQGSYLSHAGIPNLGVSSEWKYMRLRLNNLERSDYILIDNPTLDSVKVFYEKAGIIQIIVQGGDGYSFSKLNSEHPYIYGRLPQDTSIKELFVAVRSAEQIVVPLFTGSFDEVNDSLNNRKIFYAIYFGLILAMLLYNFFIYLTVRDKIYLYYVFYTFTVGFTQLILNGYGNEYLWPNSSKIGVYASAIVPIMSGWAVILFARTFILTKKFSPWIDKLLIFFAITYVVSLAAIVFGRFDISFNIINANASAALILVPAAIKGYRSGYRPAGYFLVAFGFFLFGVTLFALRNFGVVPFNTFTSFALPVGSALETVLLSFALADRINQFKKEKEESQQQSIAVMKENQRLITEQNVRLEQMVHERTLDLEKANDDLSTTLSDLRITQKQLVESEKLASLGQMTAGIAHEINNPINFVQSNVQPLRRDIDDMLSLLDEFARLENDAAISEKVAGLHKKYHELDMPYVRDEVKQLLHGIEEGSRRTAEIVRGLRVFSRMDRDSLVSASVNDCIQSTLIVMKNITKGAVTLEIELDTAMPHIYCFPGKLNQVFMNILNNAVQATDIPGRAESDRLIKILSAHDADTIRVTITDNGTGIAEGIRSRIFDPFFTTKKVGEGTGLGLSIALGIVEEHKGHIEVHSEEGKGTTVIVSLPRLADIETT